MQLKILQELNVHDLQMIAVVLFLLINLPVLKLEVLQMALMVIN